MSYHSARCDTEAELHTIEALLCILDDAAINHLDQNQTPISSGIINLIQIVGDRIKAAQKLHHVELEAHRAEQANDSPIVAMHREITRLQAIACNSDTPIPEMEAATDRMMDLADQIANLPARDANDMLHKIMGHTGNGDHDLGDCPRGRQIWAEMRKIAG